MEFEIGQIFEGEYPPEAAFWCNDCGDRYIKEVEATLDGVPRFQNVKVPDLTDEEIAAHVRAERDMKIAETDYLAMPDYPLWTACVSLAGGNAVHYVCDEKSNWYPDIDDIKSKITSNTKAIVIINPNNPTGALYPKDVLEQIVDIARQNDLIIFADEIYDRLVMDGKKHIAIASLAPDVFCVSMNGLSKSHRICGFRVGWMVLSGPKKNVRGYIEGLDMLSNMRLCSNVLSQHVIQTSLGGYQSVDELLIPGGRIYEQREFITNTVNDIPGLTAVKPDAGLYIFPKIDRNMYDIDDDEEFCLRLLKKEKVLLVPGKGFNWNEPDHFRIVYLPRVEELADLGNKIERVLSYYKR